MRVHEMNKAVLFLQILMVAPWSFAGDDAGEPESGGDPGARLSCVCRMAGHSMAREVMLMSRELPKDRVRGMALGYDSASKDWCREQGAIQDWRRGVMDELSGRRETCVPDRAERKPPRGRLPEDLLPVPGSR